MLCRRRVPAVWRGNRCEQNRMDCSIFDRASEGEFAEYLGRQRWYGGKAEALQHVGVVACVPFDIHGPEVVLLLLRASFNAGDAGRAEEYALPLMRVSADEGGAGPRLTVEPDRLLPGGVFSDALGDKRFTTHLLDCIRGGKTLTGKAIRLRATPMAALPGLLAAPGSLEPALIRVEQSNTSVRFGERLILKFFRRVVPGVNLDVETGKFLTERARFAHTPPVAGMIEIEGGEHPPATLAVLQGYVSNRGDAWKYTLESLDSFFTRVEGAAAPPAPPDRAEESSRAVALETVGPYLESAALLGRRTAELHLALTSDPSDPLFLPEPFAREDRELACSGMERLTNQAFQLLRDRLRFLDLLPRELAERVLRRHDEAIAHLREILTLHDAGERARIHGDYHLGQVLFTGSDFMIIDFEGEPERPLAERRAKRSPLCDVAGMLRSFHYAVSTALRQRDDESLPDTERSRLLEWGGYWRRSVSAEFMNAYLSSARGGAFLPRDPGALHTLLRAFLLEKAAYEIIYEFKNRPGWVSIPLDGFLAAL